MSNGVLRRLKIAFVVLMLGIIGMSAGYGCTSHASEAEDAAQNGFLALKDGKMTEAETWFQKSADRGSTDPDVWRALTGIQMKQREFSKAVQSAQRLTELAPKSAEGWKLLGTAAFRLGSQFRAFNALSQAAALKPDDPEVQEGLGQSGLQIGRLPEAKQAFETILRGRPDDPPALAGLAQTTLRMEPTPQGLARAEQEVDRALAQKETGGARLTRAQIYLAQRRCRDAITECKAVIARYPQLSLAHSLLARAAAAAGQTALARQEGAQYEALLNTAGHTAQPEEGAGRP